ncbi:MAG: hypothetical protein JJU30_13880 [Alkalimonas sp.]|nr:hypothetical protein [Alkalimonas sp.]
MRLLLLLMPLLLAACSQWTSCHGEPCQSQAEQAVHLPEPTTWYRQPSPAIDKNAGHFLMPSWPQSQKRLQHYAEQLAYQLAQANALHQQRVAISSFVELDETLSQSSPLGNQLAELLRTLLPQHGVQVVEHKLTNSFHVGPHGDFALSRDTRLLARQLPMDAILTGTLITTERGMEIQARVVQLDSQTISSSASGFIPHLVLNQIRP